MVLHFGALGMLGAAVPLILLVLREVRLEEDATG